MGELALGIDLGGTNVVSAVIDETGKILGQAKKKTRKQKTGDEILERLLLSARLAVEAAGASLDNISVVGIGSPGPLDPETGIIEFTPNLGFHNFPLRDRVQEALGRPAFVNNDVNIGTFGEWKMGAGRGIDDLVGIFIGTGIGGGLVINGQLYEGFNRMAGEIGHMVVEMDGPKCGCGNRGCLEAISSRTAISHTLYKAIENGAKSSLAGQFKGDPPAVLSKALAGAYQDKDPLTQKTLNRAADVLGVATGSLINILSPQMIVLGGGVIEALGQPYIDRIAKGAKNWAFEANFRNVQIVAAQLGDNAGIQGAAAYGRMKIKQIAN